MAPAPQGSTRPTLTAISSFSAALAMERYDPSWSSYHSAAGAGAGVNESPSVHGVASQPWPTLPAAPSASAMLAGNAASWKAGLEGSFRSISELEVKEASLPPWWADPPPAAG